MASLVIGAVGGYFFGPVGFLLGSALGSALFPTHQDGPRLTDLKLTGSSYGAMIPIPYGTVRIAPQIVWQTDLQEHAQSGGGKGGPEVTTYTYTASFAAKICKGPILGVLQIFADGTLIYDTSTGSTVDNSAIPATFYLGDNESEAPDPTMEAALGVGNVPAFRDDAAIVFTDMDLSQYGNRIPNLSVVVFTNEGGTLPARVSTWDPPVTNPDGGANAGYQTSGASLAGGILTIGTYYTFSGIGPPAHVWQTYIERTFDLDGNLLSTSSELTLPNQPTPFPDTSDNFDQFMIPCSNAQIGFSKLAHNGTGLGTSAWWVKGAMVAWPVTPAPGNEALYVCLDGSQPHLWTAPDPANSALYAVGGDSGGGIAVARYPAPNGIPSGTPDAYYVFSPAALGGYQVTVGDGYVWVLGPSRGLAGHTAGLFKLSMDLATLVHHWGDGDLPPAAKAAYTFMVSEGQILFGQASVAYLYTIDGGFTFTLVGTLPLETTTPQTYPMIPLTSCLALAMDGVLEICATPAPVTLRSIIEDVSDRCGFDVPTEIDATAQTQLVDGYTISQQGDGKAALAQLQRAYYVDAVESSAVMRWVNRGGASVVTIDDDELAAFVPPSDNPPPLATVKRLQEVDLPALVNVNYVNEDAGYQTGTQEARRQVTQSQAVAKVDLAIVMTDAKAKQIANVLLYEAEIQRTPVTVQLGPRYKYLEPTDVFAARNYALRVQRKKDQASGVIELECVETLGALYTAAFAGVATEGYSPTIAQAAQASQLVLLDIPLVADADLPLYAAMAGAVNASWPGAALYKSIDSGTTYNGIGSKDVASTIGAATTALGDFFGGNQFDELNSVTVQIGLGGGELAGATELAVLNGANMAVLGRELIQFKNADLIATRTYTLSGLLRGRRGSEWATASHVAGDRFVLLPVPADAISGSEIGLARLYKPVTRGTAIASTSAQTFTDSGVAWKPYAPVQLGGGVNGSGDVLLQWVRRTRIGGLWVDGTDIALGESSESYVVQIWDATFSLCARIITGVTSAGTTYTSAQQVTDFGAQQEHIYFTVGQLGAYGLGYQAAGVAPGGGGSDTAPLAPVTPWGVAPPSGGGACTGSPTRSTILPGVRIFNAAWTVGVEWVIAFATPASGMAHITISNYLGSPATRHGVLSTRECGDPATPAAGCSLSGPTLTFTFFTDAADNPYPSIYPTLAPSTTYYLTIGIDAPTDGFADYILG